MNSRTAGFSTFLVLAIAASSSLAASLVERDIAELRVEVDAAGAQPRDSGGGALEGADRECLSAQARQTIRLRLAESAVDLGLSAAKGGSVLFAWPVRAAAGNDAYGVHGVSNFVDHDASFPDQILDYDCGTRSYDLASGYNHRGTDIFTWPFPWLSMQNDAVEVVAAADGVILAKDDGNFDQNCGFNSGDWNAVYVQHADGSQAWYGHLKSGSLTSRSVGQTVSTGEYLGVVGSSGSSTGPHLHLELYDAGGNLLDPYDGACNPTTAASRWAEQRPYYDSAVNAVLTQTDGPVFPGCPQVETSNFSNHFLPGQSIVFATYYRDQLQGQSSQYRVYRPDGTTWASWSAASSVAHYAASYWWWRYTLGTGVPEGFWRFEVSFEGQTYERRFYVGDPTATPVAPQASRLAPAFPNPLNPTTTLAFDLQRGGRVRLEVVDLAGRQVARVFEGALESGPHRMTWNGRDTDGRAVASGVYLVRLVADEGSWSRKIVVAK